MIFITGSAGFIGYNFLLDWLQNTSIPVVSIDSLSYASNRSCIRNLKNPRHLFIHGNINDNVLISSLLTTHKPKAIIHFAAETHVDRSIHNPEIFLQTNIVGTFRLLEAARQYYNQLNVDAKTKFRFLHISTDEVFGALNESDHPFAEKSPYAPSSPYSASKASSDHLVYSYYKTYGLPVLITNCSNNFGPYQFPEKLIPLMISNALEHKPLPVYGDGKNIRDWLYVTDHAAALRAVLERGTVGETYLIGARNEKSNLSVIECICALLEELKPTNSGNYYASLIRHVTDRPGHDRRYAIDPSKIERELGWVPKETFETALYKTIHWYINNPDWIRGAKTPEYKQWLELNYAESEM